MRNDATSDLPLPRENPMAAVAAQLRALGDAVISRQLEPGLAEAVVAQLVGLTERVEAEASHTKAEFFASSQDRVTSFLETGRWPEPPPDGGRLLFDEWSAIGGELNPFSVGATYYRNGDEVLGRVTVGRCFEGPPERVHGGVICAIFDEVMGSVFRATGTASAFTGELSVRFEAPAPLGVELEFRGRLVDTKGRKRLLAGEASSPEGRFATATATFIEMRPEHFFHAPPTSSQ